MSRARCLILGCAAIAITVLPAMASLPRILIWNASASAPIGLYHIVPAGGLATGELLALDAPASLAGLLACRNYLPRGVPLMKRIAGLPGQRVCRIGRRITVDGTGIGEALDRDRQGRPLPAWHGCRRIAAGEIFVMNWTVRDSFDGRYFGPIPATSVIGRAIPVWTDEDGDGRFEWHAPTWTERTRTPSSPQTKGAL